MSKPSSITRTGGVVSVDPLSPLPVVESIDALTAETRSAIPNAETESAIPTHVVTNAIAWQLMGVKNRDQLLALRALACDIWAGMHTGMSQERADFLAACGFPESPDQLPETLRALL